MRWSFPHVVGVLLVCLTTVVQVSTTCIVDNMQVQENFQLHKYLGRWYEIAWLPQVYIPASEQYVDYQATYTMVDDHQIKANYRARVTKGASCCLDYDRPLYTTEEEGKLQADRDFNHTAYIRSDYWVITTDYENIALVYGCCQQKEDGTCMDRSVDSWFWSRTPTVTPGQNATIHNHMRDLCLDPEKYFYPSQDNDCTIQKSVTCGSAALIVNIFSLLILMFVSVWNIV